MRKAFVSRIAGQDGFYLKALAVLTVNADPKIPG